MLYSSRNLVDNDSNNGVRSNDIYRGKVVLVLVFFWRSYSELESISVSIVGSLLILSHIVY